jgi:hypothetical protein
VSLHQLHVLYGFGDIEPNVGRLAVPQKHVSQIGIHLAFLLPDASIPRGQRPGAPALQSTGAEVAKSAYVAG